MRNSLSEFVEKCYFLKTHLLIGSYEMHDYEDGAFADFRVRKLEDIHKLSEWTSGYTIRAHQEENFIVIRVFEKWNEY